MVPAEPKRTVILGVAVGWSLGNVCAGRLVQTLPRGSWHSTLTPLADALRCRFDHRTADSRPPRIIVTFDEMVVQLNILVLGRSPPVEFVLQA